MCIGENYMEQFAVNSGRVTEWHACILVKFDFLDGWSAEKGSGWDLKKKANAIFWIILLML